MVWMKFYYNFELTNYDINEYGYIRNRVTDNILKCQEDRYGYIYVSLCIDGFEKKFKIHQLVATLFLKKVKGKEKVNHKDCNKHNNHYTNLEWVTNLENMEHANKNNLLGTSKKYTRKEIELVCKLLERNLSSKEISRKSGVNISTIKLIRNKKQWTDISDNFNILKYKKKYSDELINKIEILISKGLNNQEIGRKLNMNETKHIKFINKIRNRFLGSTTIESDFDVETDDIFLFKVC